MVRNLIIVNMLNAQNKIYMAANVIEPIINSIQRQILTVAKLTAVLTSKIHTVYFRCIALHIFH